jgi:parallel beta-helix repeat protein
MNKGLFRIGLVIGIIVLFVGAGVIPSTVGIKKEKTIYTPIKSGGYIQDLIDNASDGDTIYIPSGIYYENIVIDKSISLVGENRDTTIIDGSQNGNVVYVTADGVTISGFTIMNGKDNYLFAGVDVYANYTTISDNIIKNNFIGIAFWHNSDSNYGIFLYSNIVSNNVITSNSFEGIWLHFCKDSIVENNILSNNGISSIHMYSSSNNIVSGNNVSYNDYGLSLWEDSNNNEVSRNNFVNNERYCIAILESGRNNISQNNFIESGRRNVKLLFSIWTLKRNKWNGNYWSNSKEQPHIIIVRVSIRRPGFVGLSIIPWINIDWNPASEPYDI